MQMLLITYSLKRHERSYQPLFEAIKKSGTHWWHYLPNTWLVLSQHGPHDISNKLLPLIDKQKDSLFVVEIKKNYQGWLPKEAWDWINAKIF